MGKALDGAGAEQHQHDGGNQGCDVAVKNRRKRLGITGFHRVLHVLAAGEFLADTCKDQDVRVNRHTDGQNDTGDTGQRQRDSETSQQDDHDADVKRERDRRRKPEHQVHDDHEDHDETETDGRGL